MLSTIIKEKLAKDNGESLAEVLISVLIIAVGLVLLSSLVVASSRMVNNSDTKMSKLYSTQNSIESRDSASVTKATGSTKITITGESSKSNLTVNPKITIYTDKDSGTVSYVKE